MAIKKCFVEMLNLMLIPADIGISAVMCNAECFSFFLNSYDLQLGLGDLGN